MDISIWPNVYGAPKHLNTQYLDVNYANPRSQNYWHFYVELSINNPDGHNVTQIAPLSSIYSNGYVQLSTHFLACLSA